MPPLTLKRTLSWWSDRKPLGSTINLHAAPKPLMNLMFHCQALRYMERNRGVRLSPEIMEIYFSYVFWKYVSRATKAAILKEVAKRAELEHEAHVLGDSNILCSFFQLLQCSDSEVRCQTGIILSNLATYGDESTVVAICDPLVGLLRDSNNLPVFAFVVATLTGITRTLPIAAQVAVEANVLHHVAALLDSPISMVRSNACQILASLAWHESTAAAVLETQPCERLVTLLSDSHVVDEALNALTNLAHWPDGAEAAVAAKVLDHVGEQFASPRSKVRESAGELLCKISRHYSTVPAILRIKPCELLLTLLSTVNGHGAGCAFDALINIVNFPDGAEDAVAANVLDHVAERLTSPLRWVQGSACELLAKLAGHRVGAAAILDIKLKICHLLIDHLRTDYAVGIVLPALIDIAITPDGAEALVAAHVLSHLGEHLKSPIPWERLLACQLLGNLAGHESTRSFIPQGIPFALLISLLRDEDDNVRECADKELREISEYALWIEITHSLSL
ncbi:armadillo-type protein [Mycena latifolia]|nr:armadillo-type protein [Mycena latifolia]